MVFSFLVKDIETCNYLINEFGSVIDGYVIERDIAGEPELLVLFIQPGNEEQFFDILNLVSMNLQPTTRVKKSKAVTKQVKK